MSKASSGHNPFEPKVGLGGKAPQTNPTGREGMKNVTCQTTRSNSLDTICPGLIRCTQVVEASGPYRQTRCSALVEN